MTAIEPTVRSALRDCRSIVVVGLIVIAASFLATTVLAQWIADLSGGTFDVVRGDLGTSWGVHPGQRGWMAALPLTGAVVIGAFVYGIVVGSMARVSVSAGVTRRRTWIDAMVYLAVVCGTLSALYLLALTVALIMNPSPQLLEGAAHPMLSILPTAAFALLGAALGHVIGTTFLRFPWWIGVAVCIGLFAVMMQVLDLEVVTDGSGGSLLLILVPLALAALFALVSRQLLTGMQLAA